MIPDRIESVELFWAKVDKIHGLRKRGMSRCWIWTAAKHHKGYGAFTYLVNGKYFTDRAHRFSWQLRYGPIPNGLCVLHQCDTPACVRTSHLFIGTKADNNLDMCRKGRHVSGGTHCGNKGRWRRGTKHHSAKLNPTVVTQIRTDFDSGMRMADLVRKYGLMYGIGYTGLYLVAHRRTWGYLC